MRSSLPVAACLALSGALTVAAQPAQAQASVTNIPGFLDAVSAVSASNAWAVGSDQAGTLIVHWDGSTWSRVKSPQLFDGVLNGISMASANNGWAVGNYYNNSTDKYRALMLHWNGTNWVRVAAPPRIGGLTGVDMLSAQNGWAVGWGSLTLHWNGRQWAKVAGPSLTVGGPSAVGATSASNVWAVGWYGTTSGGFPTVDTLTQHWNGTAWSQVSSPSPGGSDSELQGVSATSASDAWAVGLYVPRTGPIKTLTLHWNGTAWTQVPSPSPGNVPQARGGQANDLAGVTALSASNAWSVGDYFTRAGKGEQAPETPLILHWNGAKWVKVAVPGTTTDTSLHGISMVSSSDGWAVGQNYNTVEIMHWNGTSWSQS